MQSFDDVCTCGDTAIYHKLNINKPHEARGICVKCGCPKFKENKK